MISNVKDAHEEFRNALKNSQQDFDLSRLRSLVHFLFHFFILFSYCIVRVFVFLACHSCGQINLFVFFVVVGSFTTENRRWNRKFARLSSWFAICVPLSLCWRFGSLLTCHCCLWKKNSKPNVQWKSPERFIESFLFGNEADNGSEFASAASALDRIDALLEKDSDYWVELLRELLAAPYVFLVRRSCALILHCSSVRVLLILLVDRFWKSTIVENIKPNNISHVNQFTSPPNRLRLLRKQCKVKSKLASLAVLNRLAKMDWLHLAKRSPTLHCAWTNQFQVCLYYLFIVMIITFFQLLID